MEKINSKKQATVCLVDEQYSSYEERRELFQKLEDLNCRDVAYYDPGPRDRNSEMFYLQGVGTISGVDSNNKKSMGHHSCFSVSAFGQSSGGEVSLLAHFNEHVLTNVGDRYENSLFVRELILRLKELKIKSDKGNLQICMMGSYKNDHYYKRNIEKLKEIAKKELGIDLQILDENYEERSVKDVYIENDTRRIHQISSGTHYR